MDAFLKRIDLPGEFRRFALNRDGIKVSDAEYAETLEYLLPQLNALVARYSKLSENAFYKYYLEYVVKAAKTYGLPCFLWDNGATGVGREQHGYIDHATGAPLDNAKEALAVIRKAWDTEDASYTLDTVYALAP